MKKEEINKDSEILLKQAIQEIKMLREYNTLMATRLEMFDNMMLLVKTQPHRDSVGMSEDLVWKIEKYIESIKTTI